MKYILQYGGSYIETVLIIHFKAYDMAIYTDWKAQSCQQYNYSLEKHHNNDIA